MYIQIVSINIHVQNVQQNPTLPQTGKNTEIPLPFLGGTRIRGKRNLFQQLNCVTVAIFASPTLATLKISALIFTLTEFSLTTTKVKLFLYQCRPRVKVCLSVFCFLLA